MYLKNCFDSITFLRDSTYVTRFQQYFGLQIVHDDQDKTDQDITSTPHKEQYVPQAKKYRINNYFWFYLFSFGAKLGYEIFYSISFSYCYWNLDSFVCRRLMLVWAILMYIGQALKDIIKWPRPQGPNIIILEPEYSLEYGMPSTHAILALSMPVNLFTILLNRYEFSIPLYVIFAFGWCVLICCSRIYLGMHSILDIIAGLGLTAILLVPLLPLVNQIDRFLLHNWSSPFIVLFLVIFFASIYPTPNNLSPSRADTCVMIAGMAGVYIGSWLHYHLGIIRDVKLSLPFAITFSKSELPLLLVRTILGLMVIAVLRFVGKAFISIILRKVVGINPKGATPRQQAIVEIATKLFTYLVVGFSLAFIGPYLFIALHIHRTSMYMEA